MSESFLYSFNAKRVSSKQKANGNYKLSFDVNDAGNVSGFTERPQRVTDFCTISHFEKQFDDLFADSKPNASLNFWSEGESQLVIHTIKSMKVNKKGSKIIINAKPLQVLGFSETLPDNIAEASFFVDGSGNLSCNGQDNCNKCEGLICISA